MNALKKNIKAIFLVMLFLNFGIGQITCQTKSTLMLLDSLQIKLFPQNTDLIRINEVEGCNTQRFDSIYLVRAIQPKIKEVLPVFIRIAYTKDFSAIQPLKEIYNRQISFFKSEWEPIFRLNIYACDIANEQFSILEAFEETIHSLSFGEFNLSHNEQFAYYKNNLFLDYKYYLIYGAWRDVINEWKIYSPYYFKLRQNRWVGPPLTGFKFIEPYFDNIDSYFIEYLKPYIDTSNTISMKPSFEHWSLDVICSLTGRISSMTLNEDLLDLILKDKRVLPTYTRGRILSLYRNPAFRPMIKRKLFTAGREGQPEMRLNALNGLLCFMDRDVLNFYDDLFNEGKLTEIEIEAIKQNLIIFESQSSLSDNIKDKARKLLNSIGNKD